MRLRITKLKEKINQTNIFLNTEKRRTVKNKKRLAIILYAVYALSLVLVITFGTSLTHDIVYKLEVAFSNKNVTDVTVDISSDTELLAGRNYYPQYTAKGSFRGSAGLRYASLDPELLRVGESGQLYTSTDFDGDSFIGRVKITSAYDKDFEKIVSFKFVKKYPESFSVSYSLKGVGETAELVVGVPVYVFSRITSSSDYNVSDYTLIYDTDYFTEASDGSLIPIKPTEGNATLAFSVEYGNGAIASSKSFTVLDKPEVVEFDEIILNGTAPENFVGVRGKSISITLLKDGEAIATDYTISLAKTGDANRDGKGGMYFLTAGEKGLTITLPNGFAKTVEFAIENKILLPTLKDKSVRESHVISLRNTDVITYAFTFDGEVTYDNVTYEYDSDVIRLTTTSRSFTVDPRTGQLGTTEIKVIIDDGYTRLEDVYTVKIREDIRLMALISQNVSSFVSKVLGHMVLFAALACISMNLFKHLKIEGRGKRFLLYTLTALPVGIITELIQLFIPGRNPGVTDVLVDMLGFYLMTLGIVALKPLFAKLEFLRKRNKETPTDSEDN